MGILKRTKKFTLPVPRLTIQMLVWLKVSLTRRIVVGTVASKQMTLTEMDSETVS